MPIPRDVCASGVCSDQPCLKPQRRDSGIALESARLSLTASPFALRLHGEAPIPKPWIAVDPALNGLRVAIGDLLDVDLPGGDGRRTDRGGRRWTYRDAGGSREGITRVIVTDASKEGTGRVRVAGSGPGRVLPPTGEVTASLLFGDYLECPALTRNGSVGPRPRCSGGEVAIDCR